MARNSDILSPVCENAAAEKPCIAGYIKPNVGCCLTNTQVVGRTHRLGQASETEVTFLVPKGTMQELLHDRCVDRGSALQIRMAQASCLLSACMQGRQH